MGIGEYLKEEVGYILGEVVYVLGQQQTWTDLHLNLMNR
jgi:hypothetical protein